MNIITPHRGLVWGFEVLDPSRRRVLDRFQAANLVPTEGVNFLMRLAFKNAPAVPTWYLSLFENDYTPTNDVTAATLPGLAGEITAYTSATRVEFVEGDVEEGSANNGASLAEFIFTQTKTVRMVAMTSASAKGSTSGVALSVVRLPSPKTYDAGSALRAFSNPTAVPITL